jgi:hypothetical protein
MESMENEKLESKLVVRELVFKSLELVGLLAALAVAVNTLIQTIRA